MVVQSLRKDFAHLENQMPPLLHPGDQLATNLRGYRFYRDRGFHREDA